MNTSAGTLDDDAIRAFSGPAAAPAPAPRRRWPWVLLAAALLGLLLLSLGSLIWHEAQGIHGLAGLERWHFGFDEHGWHGDIGFGGAMVALVGVVVVLLTVALVVPLVLLGVGLAVGLALALAAMSVVSVLAFVLVAAALVLLVLSSPLWLLGLALFWALRKPSAVASPAPT